MIKRIIIYFLYAISLTSCYANNLDKFITSWKQLFPSEHQAASLFIDKIILSSDISFEQKEFFYLTNLCEKSKITLSDIQSAYQKLVYKKRFQTITFELEVSRQTTLIVTLKSNWIFNKLHLSGISINKEVYASLYTLEEGDVFDASAHDVSILAMKRQLFNEGFYNHTIQDTLVYSSCEKMITPSIVIRKGKRFLINSFSCFNSKGELISLPVKLEYKLEKSILRKKYHRDIIKKAADKIRVLFKKKGYLHPRISFKQEVYKQSNRLHVNFIVDQGPRRSLSFQGNKLFSHQHIISQIIGTDVPDWLLTPEIISTQLTHEYYKQGYWEANITYTQNQIDGGVLFTINEGNPIIISAISLIDQQSQKQESIIKHTLPLLGKNHNQDALHSMIARLTQYYQEQGFWNASISGPFFKKEKASGLYRVQLYINKGIQRIWNGYTITAQALENLDYLLEKYRTEFESETPFNYLWLQEQRHLLTEYLHKQGYWYAHCDVDFEEMHSNNEKLYLKVNWAIKPGSQVTFGKVILQGTSSIPIAKILKQIQFKEGEVWTNEKIELTRKQIKRLDIFNTIKIYPYDISHYTSSKPVILFLSDDARIEMRGRVGYFYTSKNFTFRHQSTPTLGGSWTIRNPTHQADKLSIEGDWSKFERQYLIDYQHPSFFMSSLTAKGKIYNHKYVHPIRVASGDSAYETSKDGLLIGVSKEYHENYFWGISAGNEWIKTSRIRGYLKLDTDLIEKTIPYFFFEPSLLLDKRNNQIKTTSGYLSFISCKIMIPEYRGTITASLLAEQSLYKSFYNDQLTFAVRARFGHVFRRSFNEIMPVERFYLGGPHSVRGYEKDTVPPFGVTERDKHGSILREYTAKTSDDIPHPEAVTQEFTIQGGSSMLNLNVELRYHLFSPVSIVFFQDLGILSQSGFTDLKETLYPSSGIGFRYQTPIGALRFDIGWKWKRLFKLEDSYGWHLSLGQAF